MRVKLKKDWRRFHKGKELVGAQAKEALADRAGVLVKPKKVEDDGAEHD